MVHVGHMELLKLLMIVCVLQLVVNSRHFYQSLILLHAAIVLIAFHSVAMVVKLQLHGPGLREQVLSLVEILVMEHYVTITLCHNVLTM